MTINNLIYLGNLPDLDPVEGFSTESENAGFLLGKDFAALRMVSLDMTDRGDWYVADKGELIGTGGDEPIGYNRGGGNVSTYLDGTVFGFVTVKLADGSVRSDILASVVQMENGDVFLGNHFTLTQLNGLDITQVTINRFYETSYPGYYTGSGLTGTSVKSGDGIVNGTAGADSMPVGFTDAQGDQIDGSDGNNDSIDGGGGNDTINYGAGNDTVLGGDGADVIDDAPGAGNANGNNLIYGGNGNDNLLDSSGNDTVFGDAGDDLLNMDSGGDDVLSGGAGNDTVLGGAGNDTVTTGAGDSVVGGADADTFIADRTILDANGQTTANVSVDGNNSGNDADVLDLRNAGNWRIINQVTDSNGNGTNGTVQYLDGAGNATGQVLNFTDIETILGTPFTPANQAPVFTNLTNGQTINVAENTTFVVDANAADGNNDPLTFSISGGADSSRFTIDPNTGVLTFISAPDFEGARSTIGNDQIYDVTIRVSDGKGGQQDVVLLVNVTDVNEVVRDGTVNGTAGADFMPVGFTDAQGDQIDGIDGNNDSIEGGTGNDTINYGAGNDTVLGGDGADVIDDAPGAGNANGNNLIFGGNGNDNLLDSSGNDTVFGGADDDLLNMDSGGNDQMSGDAGRDTLIGGAGTDTLTGGEDSDSLDGGLGDDDLVVGAGDQAQGGSGDDVFTLDKSLTGTSTVAIVGGETGEDLIDPANGGSGDVLDLRGQTGVVVTYNTADPTYNPATGLGESGTATYLNSLGQTVTVNFSQIETILRDAAGVVDGTDGSDNMGPGFTDPQGDQIDGGDGLNDTISAGTGDDTVDAGQGNDTALGGSGNDSLSGNVGNDSLQGDAGRDTLDGGAGNDSVLGGDGTDTLAGGLGNDTLDGGLGDDTLDGGLGDDDIAVGGADVALGGSGDDVFTVDPTDTGADLNATITGSETGEDLTDLANGGTGDSLDLSAVAAGLVISLGTNPESGTVNGLDADGATDIAFAEIEKILTGSGSDTVNGGTATGPVNLDTGLGNDSIATGSGNDTIAAGPGNDTVAAGGGNDTVSGGDGNDSLVGGDGNDTLDGGADKDTLQGDAGNDSLTGGAGNDSLVGGDGADTLDGGDDADVLEGGTGNDSLVGGGGADLITSGPAGAPDIGYPGIFAGDTNPNDDLDTVYGGGGADTISTGDDRDVVFGGTEGDSIDGGVDNDTLSGDEGVDTILGGEGADLVYGGAEGDVLYGGLSNPALDGLNIDDATDLAPTNGRDTIYGGDGADLIKGQDDADSLLGDAGADTLEGGIDNDSLYGGAENDSLDGGDGRDLLNGGAGVDTLTGGAGADAFVADGTADTITDFDVTSGLGDADPLNNDTVDLSAFYNASTLAAWNAANPGNTYNDPLDWLRADQADGVLQSAGGLRIQNGGGAVAAAGLTTENTSVICFARGTRITTIRGAVAIEDLAVDDMVLTVDNGYKPIRWIGSRQVDGSGKFAPIRFEAGVLMNDHPLTVSPQHRVQVKSSIAAKMFGSQDVLVAAKHLLGLPGVTQVSMAEVDYFHFLLDQHELVISEGAVTETLFTGPEALRAVEPEARAEILSIFPHLADLDHARLTLPVRPLVTGRMGRQLAARHLRNTKPLVA